jgi:tetratricopeptide (TPR) repeat protein
VADGAEIAFALARAHLAAGRSAPAGRLFAAVARERPIPQTHVLIGRTWREHGQYAQARAALTEALRLDPQVRRAHLELGLLALAELGRGGIDQAVAEFKAETRLAPDDPVASLELGVALVQHERFAEALPLLEAIASSNPPQARTLAYLGRAQLGLDRPREAAVALQRALDAAVAQGANRPALLAIHLRLGQALQRLGRRDEAATHFAESQRLSQQGTDAEREQLARYLSSPADDPSADAAIAGLRGSSLVAIERRLIAALARSYLNLGVLEAQRERFDAAADLLEKAASLDPDFPQVQSALGVALFNARRYDLAIAPLGRAVAAEPSNLGLKRMLAMTLLDAGEFARAAGLLRDDPGLHADPALLFAYGLALVKSDRAAEAEPIFARLLAQSGDSAELSVLVGQAHAQQGDFDAAMTALQRALQLKPGVAEANAALGVIYLRQGRMAEAEQALRAELAGNPSDLRSRHNLAVVLEAQQRPDEALVLLRSILEAKPDTADARYLTGKILLARGDAAAAVNHLETAARLTPEDAAVRYQLGQAYQKLGRAEQAQQEFETFQRLKDKSR